MERQEERLVGSRCRRSAYTFNPLNSRMRQFLVGDISIPGAATVQGGLLLLAGLSTLGRPSPEGIVTNRLLPMSALLLSLAGCGTALPIAQDYNSSIKPVDPGYEELRLRTGAADQLPGLTQGQKEEAKVQLTALAGYTVSLNKYFGAVAGVNRTNQGLSSRYGWANGVVGGLGSLLASIDSKRNWGPTAGAVGAAWTALGLTLQKAFVDPNVSNGTAEVTKIAAVRQAIDAAAVAWQTPVSAPTPSVPNAYNDWLAAARNASTKAKEILGVLGAR